MYGGRAGGTHSTGMLSCSLLTHNDPGFGPALGPIFNILQVGGSFDVKCTVSKNIKFAVISCILSY